MKLVIGHLGYHECGRRVYELLAEGRLRLPVLSFAWTTDEFLHNRKTITRRQKCRFEIGQLVMAIEKGQGIPKGGRVRRLDVIVIKSIERQRVREIPVEDLALEGGRWASTEEFVFAYCRGNGCKPSDDCWRIGFERLHINIEALAPQEDDTMAKSKKKTKKAPPRAAKKTSKPKRPKSTAEPAPETELVDATGTEGTPDVDAADDTKAPPRSAKLTMEQRFSHGWVVSAESRRDKWLAQVTDGDNVPRECPDTFEAETRDEAFAAAEAWCSEHPRWRASTEVPKHGPGVQPVVTSHQEPASPWRNPSYVQESEEAALKVAQKRCDEKARDAIDRYVERRRAEAGLFPKLAEIYERIGELNNKVSHHSDVVKDCKKSIEALHLQASDLVLEVRSPQLRLHLERPNDVPPKPVRDSPKGRKRQADLSERAADTEAVVAQAESDLRAANEEPAAEGSPTSEETAPEPTEAKRPGLDPTAVQWPEEGAPA